MIPMIVGVTGKIGSGKSTGCLLLKKKLEEDRGYRVKILDCDSLFKAHVAKNPLYLQSLKRLCRLDHLTSDAVFEAMLEMNLTRYHQLLQNINFHMYPVIASEISNADENIIIIESAYLLETALTWQCDFIISINVSRNIREKRLFVRDAHIRDQVKTLQIMDLQDVHFKHRNKGAFLDVEKNKSLCEFKLTDDMHQSRSDEEMKEMSDDFVEYCSHRISFDYVFFHKNRHP